LICVAIHVEVRTTTYMYVPVVRV